MEYFRRINYQYDFIMDLREGLGYKYLSPLEQQAYKIMLDAFSQMASSFDCSMIDKNIDLMKVVQVVLGDNPFIIYFDKTKIRIEESSIEERMVLSAGRSKRQIKTTRSSGRRIILTGVREKPQADKMIISLDKKVNRIISSIKKTSDDDYSLLISLYKYLQENIIYCKGKNISFVSHNAYGALINGTAVCDGFSSAFSLLAQKLGYQCMLAAGNSAYSMSSYENHAWNIIKINNKYYHMDITWDARKFEDCEAHSFVYFAVNDLDMAADHSWSNKTAPACSGSDFSYYKKNGLFINNFQQLCNSVAFHIKNKINIFQYKFSVDYDYPSKNMGKYAADIILSEALKYDGRQKKISYSWNGKARCFYARIISK